MVHSPMSPRHSVPISAAPMAESYRKLQTAAQIGQRVFVTIIRRRNEIFIQQARPEQSGIGLRFKNNSTQWAHSWRTGQDAGNFVTLSPVNEFHDKNRTLCRRFLIKTTMQTGGVEHCYVT